MYDDHLSKMNDEENLLNSEFYQLELDRLRRIYRTEQRELKVEQFVHRHQNRIFAVFCLAVFAFGYLVGTFLR